VTTNKRKRNITTEFTCDICGKKFAFRKCYEDHISKCKLGRIYKFTNKITGLIYIGQTKTNLCDRICGRSDRKLKYHTLWDGHYILAFEKNSKAKFHNALREYSKENWDLEIIEEIQTDELLNDREVYWIAYYDSFNNGYNSTLGGKGAKGYKQTEHQRKRISKIMKERWANGDFKDRCCGFLSEESIKKMKAYNAARTKQSRENAEDKLIPLYKRYQDYLDNKIRLTTRSFITLDIAIKKYINIAFPDGKIPDPFNIPIIELTRIIIYKFTNKINGKCFIGKTNKTVCHAFCGKKNYKKPGHYIQAFKENSNKHLHIDLRDHGVSNFDLEILEVLDNETDTKCRLKYWTKVYDADKGYNSTDGSIKRSQESIDKIRETNKEIWSDPIRRQEQSERVREQRKNPELIAKISKALTGRKLSDEHKSKVLKGLNKYWSDPENKKKHSELMKTKEYNIHNNIDRKKQWADPKYRLAVTLSTKNRHLVKENKILAELKEKDLNNNNKILKKIIKSENKINDLILEITDLNEKRNKCV
jgi:hypothetical protein